MIVRNEAVILRRALLSVADHIDYWVICDTGSTDETKDLIRSFFLDRNIPGELHSIRFENFAQARNEALDHARASTQHFDYLLLMDADMELVVENGTFPRQLGASSYLVKQKAGISYWNTRLLRRDAPARYHGVTHEYLDRVSDQEALHSIWFMDHTDGANRTEKLERDIRLLEDGLAREPDNGRYVYYLAQSYREAGRLAEAADAYTRRVSMGGWDEERWHAQLQASRCYLGLGDDARFLSAAAKAFELRPHRAEPLYELAKFHRLRDQNETAMVYCEAAFKLPWPKDDILFVEDFVYTVGIQEEASIAGFYCKCPERREAGRRACFGLAANRDASKSTRDLARRNQCFYAQPANLLFPSLRTWQLAFKSPAGGSVTNPSVAVWDQTAYVLVRNVNYSITETGSYIIPNNGPIETRNYLLRLDAELLPQGWGEIRPPFDLPPPRYSLVRGFEDARLFVWRDSLWCSSTVRELTHEGWCEIVLARIDRPLTPSCISTDWRVLEPEGPRQHQKNWMPQVNGDCLRFIYSVDPMRLVDEYGRNVSQTIPSLAFEHLRGGSQAIAFDGGWLALTHEVSQHDKRIYLHRFVWFDATMALRLATPPFYFNSLGIEYAAGLAWHPDARRLIVSFGVADAEARMGTVSAGDIRAALTASGCANIGAQAAQSRELRVNRASVRAKSDKRIPKAYCIVCPQMPDRRSAAEAHFHERGLDVELFDGIHGSTWGLVPTKTRADGKRMSPGATGLLLSHWLLWRVAERQHDEEILVFEDDVILPIDFEVEFQRSYEQLPADWQFVFVGFVGNFPSEPIAERVSVIRYPYGTHAYLVKKSALRTLIETNQEARTHLDLALIENTLPRLKCYTFTPSLAGQRTYAGEWPTSAGDASTPIADIALPTARSLKPAEQISSTMTKAVISLHDQATELYYPESIQRHIDRLFGPLPQGSARSSGSVISIREIASGRYSIGGDARLQAGDGLGLTELFDVLLEQVLHSLIDKLDSAVALHAASIGWADKCIIIPGPTGAGKTSLAGWFVANNFEFLTDELVVLPGAGRMILSFPRPLLAKPGAEELIAIVARSGRSQTVPTAANTIINIEPSTSAENMKREAGLIVFPRFVAGSELEVKSVSPAMTGLKLMECNLNARNLADHGLATVASFSRSTPALSLTYGRYEQLDGIADTFAKLVSGS